MKKKTIIYLGLLLIAICSVNFSFNKSEFGELTKVLNFNQAIARTEGACEIYSNDEIGCGTLQCPGEEEWEIVEVPQYETICRSGTSACSPVDCLPEECP